MTDNSTSASGWYSYCDVAVDAAETTTSLCHHASLDVVVATTDENQLIIYDANSGKLLQSYEHNKKIGGALQCVYHEAGGGLAISDGINFGYRRQSNGLVLLNEALQTQIKSSKENVCIELQHSEATLLMSFISESTSESSHDVKVDEISNGDVKELYKTLLKQVKTESGHSQTSVGASSKWNTVIVELPYETVKNACLNLLEPYHKYLTDMAKADGVYRNTVASINASYGLPIVSSILHRLVLLYPCDHPGCVGKVIESPNRSLMYSELARGATFTRWPHRRYRWASPKAMAQAGFYHQPSAMGDDRALCFACNVCLVCWEPSDEPWSEHERHSPGCPFVCGEPTVNIPLSLTYALQPAHRMPFSDADAQSYFMAIAQNSGYLMTATTEGHLAMWNINKVSKLVARLRLSTETFTEALKDRITTSRKYATCTSFEITSLCALENTSSETNDNGGQEDEKTDRQSTCMALGAVVCVEEANSDDATEVEDNSSSVDGSAKKKMSSCLYSIVVIIKPILKRSHTRKPTSSTLKLSEAAFYHEAIPTDAYPGDMYPEPDEPLPNGAMTPIPINIQSFTPPPDATLIVMSDEDTDVQEEDKSNKEEEPLLKASNEEIKKKDGDHSKLEVISCCVIDKIDDISSFGVDDEAIKRVTRMVCDKAENVAVLSVKSSIDGNNGICKLDLVTNTTQFALNNLSISKISYVPHDFTEPLSDCDTYNSDNEDLNLSGYESSSTNTQEFIMCLSECGKILLLEINTLEIVHEFMLNDVWNDTQNNNTATGGRITSFVYCPSNKICISTNISKMMFVKFGKQAKPPVVPEVQPSPIIKTTIADKPVNLPRLHKMNTLTKSEVLKPRFTCITGNCWLEISTDHQTSSSLGSKPSSHLKQTNAYKGLLANAYADVNSQFLRRHFHHPAQHCASDVAAYTRSWRMQADSMSWDFHTFDIVLPRATSISHVELKFVLGAPLTDTGDIEITMVKDETKPQKLPANKPQIVSEYTKHQHLLSRNIASCNSSHQPILYVEEIEESHDESAYVSVTLVDGDETKVYGQLHKYHDKELSHGSLVQVLALMWCEVGGEKDMRIVCGIWDKVDPNKMEGLSVRNMNKPPPLQNIPENQLPDARNKILFGPRKLSEYVDSSGNGGTVVIKGEDIVAQSKIKTFLLHIKATGEEDFSDKWRNKGCNIIQEVSITVYKFVKDKPQVSRSQRIGICSNADLHKDLLSNLFTLQDNEFNLLPAKLALLDLLCWITCMAQKSLDTVCQYINEHFDEILKFGFLNTDKEISAKTMTLLLLTVLNENYTSLNETFAIYIQDVKTCIEECLRSRVNNFVGLSSLFQVLDILLLQATVSDDSSVLVKVVKDLFKILTEAGHQLSLMDPLYRTLRSKYGLYGFPLESELFSVDINAARTFGIFADVNAEKNSSAASDSLKHKQWENYFSKEELNVCNLYNSDVTEQLVSKTIYLQDSQGDACLGVLDCLPLHYKAVDMSEGCTVRGNSNTEINVPSTTATDVNMNVMPKPLNNSGKSHLESSIDYNLTAMLNKVGGLKNYVNNLSSPKQDKQPPEIHTSTEDSDSVHKLKDTLLSSFNFKIPNVPTESPYPISLTVTKMHSGARRHVVLDFGHVMEINSMFMYACRDLSSMTIESWVYGTKNGPKSGQPATHFATILDICDHDFNLKNISPSLVCQFLKVSFVGRYGTTNAQSLIRLGRFYGIPACVGYSTATKTTKKVIAGQQPNAPIYTLKNMYTNMPVVKSAIQKFLHYLRTCQEDCECRYTLAANKLKNIIARQEMFPNDAAKGNADSLTQALNSSLALQSYQNTINLQIRLVRISATIQRMQSLLDFSSTYSSQDSIVSISQLETFGYLVVNSILSTCLTKSALPLQVLAQDECSDLFGTICHLGFPRLRLCTAVAMMQYAAPMEWFGNFISSCLNQIANFQPNQTMFVSQEHLSSLLLVIGHKCLENEKFSERIIDSLLKHIMSLFLTISDQRNDLTTSPELKNLTWFIYYFTNLSEKALCYNQSLIHAFHTVPVDLKFPKPDTRAKSAKYVSAPPLPPYNPPAPTKSSKWNFLTVSGKPATLSANEATMAVLKKIEWYLADITSKRDDVVKIYSAAIQEQESTTDGSAAPEFSLSKNDVEKVKFNCANISKYRILLNAKNIKKELEVARNGAQQQTKQNVKASTTASSTGLSFVSISQSSCTSILKHVVKFLCSLNASVPSDSVVLLCKFASILVKWCGLQTVHKLYSEKDKDASVLRFSDIITSEEFQQLILLSVGGKMNSNKQHFMAPSLGPWLKHALSCFIVEALEVESYVGKMMEIRKNETPAKDESSDAGNVGLSTHNDSMDVIQTLKDKLPEVHKKRVSMVDLFFKSCTEIIESIKKDMAAHGELADDSKADAISKPSRTANIKHDAKNSCQLAQKIVHEALHEQPAVVKDKESTISAPTPWLTPSSPSTSTNFPPPDLAMDEPFDVYDSKIPDNLKAFLTWDEGSIPKASPPNEITKQNQRPLCSAGLDSRTSCGLFSQVKHQHQMYLMANHKLAVNSIICVPTDNGVNEDEEITSTASTVDAVISEEPTTNTFSVVQNVVETLLLPENIRHLSLPPFIEFIFKFQNAFSNNSNLLLSFNSLKALLRELNCRMRTRHDQQLFLNLLTFYTQNVELYKVELPAEEVANGFTILLSTNDENTWITSQSTKYAIGGPSLVDPLHACMAKLNQCKYIMDNYCEEFRDFFLSVIEKVAINDQFLSDRCTPTDCIAEIATRLLRSFSQKSGSIKVDLKIGSNVIVKVLESTLSYLNNLPKNSKQLQTHSFITEAVNPFKTSSSSSPDREMRMGLLFLCLEMITKSRVAVDEKADNVIWKSSPLADLLLKNTPFVNNLLACLVACKGGSLNEHSIPQNFNYKKLQQHMETIADGVLVLACSLYQSSSKDSQVQLIQQIIHCISNQQRSLFGIERPQMSETLCLFILDVLNDVDAAKVFCQSNGLQIVAESLVSTVHENIDHNPNVTSKMMQFMTSSYERLAYTMPLPPVAPDYNGWPPLGTKNTGGSTKSLIKLSSGNVVPNPNYSGVVSGAVHPSVFPDIKVLTDPELEGGLTNFALNASLQCSDKSTTVPESLIKNRGTGIHRRARAPSWSYHFSPGRTWVTLTLQFPKAFVLKSVTVIPMLMALNTSPSYITVEASSVNHPNFFYSISGVMPTSGLSAVEVEAPSDQVITAVRIHLAKPLSSQSMGLTRILVHGYPTFKHSENTPTSSTKHCAYHQEKSSVQNKTNSFYWLSLLNHCLYNFSEDEELKSKVLEQILHVQNLPSSLCLLLNSSKTFVYHSMIESVLFTTYLHGVKTAENLIPYLLKQADNLPHSVDAVSQISKVQVLYDICTKEDEKLPITLKAVVDMLNKIAAMNQMTNSNSFNLIPAQLHTIACAFWKNSKTNAASEALNEETVKNMCNWLSSMTTSRASSTSMQLSLQWLLCSFVNVDTKYLQTILNMQDLSYDSNTILWLSKVCQNNASVDYLMDNNLVNQLSKALTDYCDQVLQSIDDESTLNTQEGSINGDRLVAIVKFFTELCTWNKIQNWLGSETGQLTWICAIKLLYVCLPKPSSGSSTTACPLSRQLLLQLQDDVIKLLKALVMCNEHNQKLLSNVIVELLQSKLGITGFLKLVLSEVVLDMESVSFGIHTEKQTHDLPTGLVSSSHHPSYGTGRNNGILRLDMKKKLSEVKTLWQAMCAIPLKLPTTKRNKLQPKQGFVEPIPPELLMTGSTHSMKLDASQFPALMKHHKELADKFANKKGAKPFGSLNPSEASTSSMQSLENAGLSAVKKRQKKSPVTSGPDVAPISLKNIKMDSENYEVEFDGIKIDESLTIAEVISTYRSFDKDNMLLSFNMVTEKVKETEIDVMNEKNAKASFSCPEPDTMKSMLEHFADIGGLSLLASRLSVNNTRVTSLDAVAEVNKPLMNWKEDEFEWLYSSVDSLVFSDEDMLLDEQKSSMSSNNKNKLKDGQNVFGNVQANNGVPNHTMTALLMFLRLPKYANQFLKNRNIACTLLKILIGVADESTEEQFYNSNLAPELSLQPYTTLRELLASMSPSSEEGGNLRNVMMVGDSSMHLLLACYAHFTHHVPDGTTAAGRSLIKLIPEQEVVKVVEVPPQKPSKPQPMSENLGFMDFPTGGKQAQDQDKLFWAKGTGFGTGSTTSNWNIDRAVKKQKQDEHYITAILQILNSFISPNDSDDCVQLEAEQQDNLTSLFIASGLFSSLSSYLRNDSVLDMASHVPLYKSILMLLRGFARCDFLTELLVDTPLSQTADGTVNYQTENLCELLNKMRSCVDRYSDRLKNFGAKSSEPTGTNGKGLSVLIKDIQDTEQKLKEISESFKLKKEQESQSTDASEALSTKPNIPLSHASLEEKYIKEMKSLQFDTHALVTTDEKGKMQFNVSHNYASHIKSIGQVTNPNRALRLAQEAVTLSNSLPLSYSSTVFVRCDEERLDTMKVLMTGPCDTPYANGCFEFDVFFPAGYNNVPPMVNLQTTGHNSVRFNPNLYVDGKVCLSILNTWHGRPEEKWNPQTSSFLQVLVSIQSLILVSEPYFNEPGYERSRGTKAGTQSSIEYDSNIQQATVKWAMLNQLKNPSACFKEIVDRHFWMKRGEVLEQCDKWLSDMKKHVKTSDNRGRISHHCAALKNHLNQLRTALMELKCPSGLEDFATTNNGNNK